MRLIGTFTQTKLRHLSFVQGQRRGNNTGVCKDAYLLTVDLQNSEKRALDIYDLEIYGAKVAKFVDIHRKQSWTAVMSSRSVNLDVFL